MANFQYRWIGKAIRGDFKEVHIMGGLRIRDRKTGEEYTAYPQAVDLNYNGKYVLRYIIGIQGHSEFHFIHAIYDNDEFNSKYQVIEEV